MAELAATMGTGLREKNSSMTTADFHRIFEADVLNGLVPATLSDQFFDALYGDAADGAYDISLHFSGANDHQLAFEFHLNERPGKCLVCNLTYGLPEVFSRHPLIDVKGLVKKIENLLEGTHTVSAWKIGRTREISRKLHVIPLLISLAH